MCSSEAACGAGEEAERDKRHGEGMSGTRGMVRDMSGTRSTVRDMSGTRGTVRGYQGEHVGDQANFTALKIWYNKTE